MSLTDKFFETATRLQKSVVEKNADGGAAQNEALALKYRHRIRRPI